MIIQSVLILYSFLFQTENIYTKEEIIISVIKLRKQKYSKYYYSIIEKNTEIGNITFCKKNNILIICFLEIYPEYRHKSYGYQIIEYLLSHYKTKCIIGETLLTLRGFWNKCIKKYNGQRKNISYSDNCTSSFIIPKYKMNQQDIYDLLFKVNKEIYY